MTTSKLPEWPEKESFDMGIYSEERHYYAELSEAALARMEALEKALRELHALVKGECPSLLNEDSGGDSRLDMEIEDALAACARKEAGR